MRKLVFASALSTVLATSACAAGSRPSTAPVVETTLQQLYMAERYGEVVLAASSIIDAHADRERTAEARFFRALAWLAQNPHANEARALLEFRTLEFEYDDLLWGRIAALYVAAATRVDALQATLLELGFEQRELHGRIEALEQQLADLHAELVVRDEQIKALERERNELIEQLEEARKQTAATLARLRELEDELAALKQIDMQREP